MIRLPCSAMVRGSVMPHAFLSACACQPAVRVEGGGLAPAGAGCCLPAIPGPGVAEAQRARVGPQDAFRGAVGKDLGVPLRVEGRARNLRGPQPARRLAREFDSRTGIQIVAATIFFTSSRRPHGAARAVDSARTPSLPLALPLWRRQRRSAGAKIIKARAAFDMRQSPKCSSRNSEPELAAIGSRCAPERGIVRPRPEPVKSACGVGYADLRLLMP